MAKQPDSTRQQYALFNNDRPTFPDWLGLLGISTPLLVYGAVIVIGLATGNLSVGG